MLVESRSSKKGEPLLQAVSRVQVPPREVAGPAVAEPMAWVSPEMVWGFARRQARVILFVTLVALVIGGAVAALAPPRFRSTAELLVDPRGLQILKNEITKSSDSTDG